MTLDYYGSYGYDPDAFKPPRQKTEGEAQCADCRCIRDLHTSGHGRCTFCRTCKKFVEPAPIAKYGRVLSF